MDSIEPLKLPTNCSIQTSHLLHDAFRAAFQAGDDVEIDAAQVLQVDMTFVHLLVSATKTAKARHKRMRLAAISEPLRDALARAGLQLTASEDQITWT